MSAPSTLEFSPVPLEDREGSMTATSADRAAVRDRFLAAYEVIRSCKVDLLQTPLKSVTTAQMTEFGQAVVCLVFWLLHP